MHSLQGIQPCFRCIRGEASGSDAVLLLFLNGIEFLPNKIALPHRESC